MGNTAELYIPQEGIDFKALQLRVPENITSQLSRTKERVVSFVPKKEIFHRQKHIEMKNFELQATHEPYFQRVSTGVDLNNYTLQQTQEKPMDVKVVETLNYVDLAGGAVGAGMIIFGVAGGWAVLGLSALSYGTGYLYSRWRMRNASPAMHMTSERVKQEAPIYQRMQHVSQKFQPAMEMA